MRRDGFYFYRSILLKFFEYNDLVLVDTTPKRDYKMRFKALIERLEVSQKEMIDISGYDKIVIKDFF